MARRAHNAEISKFNSYPVQPFSSELAQQAEQVPVKDKVADSNSALGAILNGSVAQLARAPVSKTEGWGFKSLLVCHFLGVSLLNGGVD